MVTRCFSVRKRVRRRRAPVPLHCCHACCPQATLSEALSQWWTLPQDSRFANAPLGLGVGQTTLSEALSQWWTLPQDSRFAIAPLGLGVGQGTLSELSRPHHTYFSRQSLVVRAGLREEKIEKSALVCAGLRAKLCARKK